MSRHCGITNPIYALISAKDEKAAFPLLFLVSESANSQNSEYQDARPHVNNLPTCLLEIK